MSEQPELVTVFRSLDAGAREDAQSVRVLLADAGLSPVLLDDEALGVLEGTYEVRVPADQAARAEELIASQSAEAEITEATDDSAEMDLVTIFQADAGSVTAVLEATEIDSLLKASGIDSVIIGTPTMPNLPFEVRVPKTELERALQVLEEAQAAGPAGAEEAAEAGESTATES